MTAISNWRIEYVTNMQRMFSGCNGLTNLNFLSNWNVKVANYVQMFQSCANLTDASGINDWNINAIAMFTDMFKSTPVHPEFTKFPNGTWDSNGTFTPNA